MGQGGREAGRQARGLSTRSAVPVPDGDGVVYGVTTPKVVSLESSIASNQSNHRSYRPLRTEVQFAATTVTTDQRLSTTDTVKGYLLCAVQSATTLDSRPVFPLPSALHHHLHHTANAHHCVGGRRGSSTHTCYYPTATTDIVTSGDLRTITLTADQTCECLVPPHPF